MFREFKCGCIFSEVQGRVRICETHRPEVTDGSGGNMPTKMPRVIRYYPANGEMCNWSGK